MKTIKSSDGKHSITLYESIEDMPCVRYHKFNQLLVQSSSVGSSVQDFNARISSAISFINNNQPKKACLELKNLSFALQFASTLTDPASQAFACLVKSIDGVDRNDLTTQGINDTAAILDEFITVHERDGINDDVKKKQFES